MNRRLLITVSEHAALCVQTYLDFLKGNISESDYVNCINSHTSLANDRLYRQYLERKHLDEYNSAKSQVLKSHSKYLRSTNHVQNTI